MRRIEVVVGLNSESWTPGGGLYRRIGNVEEGGCAQAVVFLRDLDLVLLMLELISKLDTRDGYWS